MYTLMDKIVKSYSTDISIVVILLHVSFQPYACVFHVLFYSPCLFFVHLLGRIWDPGFACPDIESVVTPEEDAEYLDDLAEQL